MVFEFVKRAVIKSPVNETSLGFVPLWSSNLMCDEKSPLTGPPRLLPAWTALLWEALSVSPNIAQCPQACLDKGRPCAFRVVEGSDSSDPWSWRLPCWATKIFHIGVGVREIIAARTSTQRVRSRSSKRTREKTALKSGLVLSGSRFCCQEKLAPQTSWHVSLLLTSPCGVRTKGAMPRHTHCFEVLPGGSWLDRWTRWTEFCLIARRQAAMPCSTWWRVTMSGGERIDFVWVGSSEKFGGLTARIFITSASDSRARKSLEIWGMFENHKILNFVETSRHFFTVSDLDFDCDFFFELRLSPQSRRNVVRSESSASHGGCNVFTRVSAERRERSDER